MADARINVYSPSGKFGTLEESELEAALAQGFRLATDGEKKHENLKEITDNPIGAAAALTTSAIDTATFGASDYLTEKFFPEQKEIIDAARESNPIASGIGTAGGFVAGATGTVAKVAVNVGTKAAGKVAALGGSKVVQTAAKLGAEGLVAGAPLATAQLLAGDPEEAAETLLFTGLSGTVFGAVGQKGLDKSAPLRAILSKKIAGAEQAIVDGLDRMGTFASAKAAGFSKGMVAKAGLERTKELADFAQEKGLVKLFSKTEDTFQIVEELRKREGKEIGRILREIDKQDKRLVDPHKLMQTIRSSVEAPEGKLLAPERNAFNRAFEDIFNTITEKGVVNGNKVRRFKDEISLQDMQKLKTNLGNYAYRDWSQVRPARELVAQMERIVDSTIDGALDTASNNFPGYATKWRQAKIDYQNYNDLLKPIKNQFAIEVGNKLIGPSDMAFGIMGATQGGAKGALLGWIFNEARQRYAAKGAASVLDGINKAVEKRNSTITASVAKYFGRASSTPPGVRPAAIAAGRSFFDSKKDKKEQLLELGQRLDSLATNPQELTDSLTELSEDTNAAHEGVGAQLQSQTLRALGYLGQHIPRPLSPNSPFEDPRFHPSDREVASFDKRLKAALDPYSVLDDFDQGRASREGVETLKELYPHFHSQVSQAVIEQAGTRKRALTFSERLQLSLLLSTPIEPLTKPENVSALQSLYGKQSEAEKIGTGKQLNLAEKSLTPAQRITAR